jgi:hypothetical protein
MKDKLIILLSTLLLVVVSFIGVDIAFAAMRSANTIVFGMGLLGLCGLATYWFFWCKFALSKVFKPRNSKIHED